MKNIASALTHLKKDPILVTIIEKYPAPQWKESHDLFEDLLDAITSQQLSTKAAATIFKRVKDLYSSFLNPEEILKTPDETLRACGISYSKIKYIKGICEAIIRKELELPKLTSLSDEEVLAELVKLKGIGKWTAEMILMFSLNRMDVFSMGDLGLRSAVAKLYEIDRDDLKAIEAISLKWKPYRTVAARYLWMSLDNTL